MKRLPILVACACVSTAVFAADARVSIHVGEPGFYGRIDIVDYPPPQLVFAEPVIVQPAPASVVREPIYLHVPPGHAKDWRKHCRKYNACGERVYFVQEDCYNDVYVPRHRDGKHNKKKGKGPKEG